MMDYCWTKTPSGQYVDGHECEDVVQYRQSKFLPHMALYEGSLQMWKDGISDLLSEGPQPLTRCTVIWHHDESTFYANDRRKVFWVHKNETAILKQKGDGASLMVADGAGEMAQGGDGPGGR